MDALNAAKGAGASWSDARIGRYRQNFVGTREKQIVQVGDTDSIGIGVRALVNGAWGFAASQTLTQRRRRRGGARGGGDREGESHSRRGAGRARAGAGVSRTRRGRARTRSIRSRFPSSRRRSC